MAIHSICWFELVSYVDVECIRVRNGKVEHGTSHFTHQPLVCLVCDSKLLSINEIA